MCMQMRPEGHLMQKVASGASADGAGNYMVNNSIVVMFFNIFEQSHRVSVITLTS